MQNFRELLKQMSEERRAEIQTRVRASLGRSKIKELKMGNVLIFGGGIVVGLSLGLMLDLGMRWIYEPKRIGGQNPPPDPTPPKPTPTPTPPPKRYNPDTLENRISHLERQSKKADKGDDGPEWGWP